MVTQRNKKVSYDLGKTKKQQGDQSQIPGKILTNPNCAEKEMKIVS